MSASVSVRASLNIGQNLPAIGDLLEQLNFILTDPTPGGLLQKKQQVEDYIDMASAELERVQNEFSVIKAQMDVLISLLTGLTSALKVSGVALVEFSGSTYGEVLDQLSQKADVGEPQPRANPAYGVMLVANTPNAAYALQTLLGVGRAIKAPWDTTPPGS